MNSIIGILIVALSSYAFAQTHSTEVYSALGADQFKETSTDKIADTSSYQKVKAMLETGTLPSINQVSGWVSGRCYRFEAVSKPIAAVLVGESRLEDNGHGPVDPPREKFKIGIFVKENGAPTSVDVLTPEIEKNSSDLFEASFPVLTEVAVERHGLANFNTTLKAKYHLRLSGAYLAAEVSSTVANSPIRASYCYFFNKLK
jgi:hypothetical protein